MPAVASTQAPTRQVMSRLMKHLMVEHNQGYPEVAQVLDTTVAYVRKKINNNQWTVDDIDVIAAHYNITPADVVSGYPTLSRKD